MASDLDIEDIVDAPLYRDRKGESHPNQAGGISSYFSNRIVDLFFGCLGDYLGSGDIFAGGGLLYGPINAAMIKIPRRMSKDAFSRNWIIDGLGRVVAIDYGTLRWLPPQLDLVNVIEGSGLVRDDDETEKMLTRYLDLSRNISGFEVRTEEFLHGYELCGVQRHLELCGYGTLGYLGCGKGMALDERLLRHIGAARKHLGRCRAAFSDNPTGMLALDDRISGIGGLIKAKSNH